MKQEKQVLLVLGGGINPNGSLRGPSMQRVKRAALLYHEGFAKYIIVSGKYSHKLKFIPQMTIAEAMKIELIKLKVPENQIILENKSGDTVTNIYFTKIILKQYQWYNLEVVTSSYQLKRARYLCQKILGSDYQFDFTVAPNGLSYFDLIKQKMIERVLLKKTKQGSKHIKDGDDESITVLLIKMKHPDFTKDDSSNI